jgi:phenylpropionate dioxygenase-like ring-hydroxylating dioxygenase large terminal subunit
MINPHDIYGKQMSKNLTLAGFKIPGFHDFPTLHHQSQRFLQIDDDEETTKQHHNSSSGSINVESISTSSDHNNCEILKVDGSSSSSSNKNNGNNGDNYNYNRWHDAKSFTMRTYYEKYIHNDEKKRLKTLELFDEIEEFNLLMDHYSFTIATIGNRFKSIMKL